MPSWPTSEAEAARGRFLQTDMQGVRYFPPPNREPYNALLVDTVTLFGCHDLYLCVNTDPSASRPATSSPAAPTTGRQATVHSSSLRHQQMPEPRDLTGGGGGDIGR